MKKLKSTFFNMVVVLTVTTVVAGALLGWVYNSTAEARQAAEAEQRRQALATLGIDFDNDPAEEAVEYELRENGPFVTVYPMRLGSELKGLAVESSSDNGFAGRIVIITGFTPEGTISGYQVTQHAETPGLGAKMNDWFRPGRPSRDITGRNPGAAPLSVSKDGGDIDGITAATISSRAFLEAVNDGAKGAAIYINSNSNTNR